MSLVSSNVPSAQLHATSRSLPIALLRARERVMGPIRAMLSDAGVTEQQWRVLRVLEERGASDATEVANAACLLMPSLTRILQHLEKKGLCTRRTHPKDKRRALIEISAAGRTIITENAPEAGRIFAQIEQEIGPEKFNTLLDLLNELVEAQDAGPNA